MIHPKLNLKQGKNCSLHRDAHIGFSENGKGILTLGNKVKIRHGCILRTCGGTIALYDNVIINYNCTLHALGGILIGENTMLSPDVSLYAQNHGISKHTLIRNQRQKAKGIFIEKDCWIGAKAVILDGVKIGRGVIVGAGSVVTKNIPDYEIWGGNPAKKIGERK